MMKVLVEPINDWLGGWLSLWLTRAAQISNRFIPWQRAWAQTRLATRIAAPVPTSLVILGQPQIHGTKRLQFGSGVYLYRDLYFETHGAGSIAFGAGVVLARGVTIVAHAPVTIGAGVMIGENTNIRTSPRGLEFGGPVRLTDFFAAPITIEHDVWLGREVTILAGVSIGAGAIIGDHAVITRDVPAGATIRATVPARQPGARAAAHPHAA
jgi:acetyltransferase-like isoleucine patch superfamily enzyme